MKYHLFAHNKKNNVKVGDKVKKYVTKIGSIGTANGSYWAHLHFSISEGLTVAQLRSYINGWSVEKVKQFYRDPRGIDFEKMFGRKMDVGNAGYDWLQEIANGSPHPGVDVNGLGGGNSDIGYGFTSSCDGKVIYVSESNEKDGWGKLLVIQESLSSPKIEVQATPKTETTLDASTPKQDEIVPIPVTVTHTLNPTPAPDNSTANPTPQTGSYTAEPKIEWTGTVWTLINKLKDMKKWYLSRTIVLAILQGILGVIVVVETQYPTAGTLLIVKSILDTVLRFATTQPVDTK